LSSRNMVQRAITHARQTPTLTSLRRRFDDVEMCFLLFTGWLPIHALRIGALSLWGANIARTAVVSHGAQVRSARKLKVGSRSQVGERAVLDSRGGLTIDHDVNLSSEVQIWTAQHDWADSNFAYKTGAVFIGHHVWLGPRVTVLPGSVILPGTVVAAGAVVSGTVGPDCLVAGVPARKLRDRPPMTYKLPTRSDKAWWW
jgi:acetyltransferase-like isoleucine patch superfamily enzyme